MKERTKVYRAFLELLLVGKSGELSKLAQEALNTGEISIEKTIPEETQAWEKLLRTYKSRDTQDSAHIVDYLERVFHKAKGRGLTEYFLVVNAGKPISQEQFEEFIKRDFKDAQKYKRNGQESRAALFYQSVVNGLVFSRDNQRTQRLRRVLMARKNTDLRAKYGMHY